MSVSVFELYFSDLTEQAQQSLLKAAGMQDQAENNWDVFPITTMTFEHEEDEEE